MATIYASFFLPITPISNNLIFHTSTPMQTIAPEKPTFKQRETKLLETSTRLSLYQPQWRITATMSSSNSTLYHFKQSRNNLQNVIQPLYI